MKNLTSGFDNFDEYVQTYRTKHDDNISLTGANSEYFADYKVKEISNLFNLSESSILDYGCGDGVIYKHLNKYFVNFKYYGLDVSELSIAIAKSQNKNSNAVFEVYDGNKIPFANDSFGFVFSACVFHHIDFEFHEKILNDIYDKLKPGGRLIIFEHNPLNPLTRHMVNTCEFDVNARLLSHYYSKKLFKSSKFKNCKVRFTLFFPRYGIFKYFHFLEKYLWWLAFGGQYYLIAEKK